MAAEIAVNFGTLAATVLPKLGDANGSLYDDVLLVFPASSDSGADGSTIGISGVGQIYEGQVRVGIGRPPVTMGAGGDIGLHGNLGAGQVPSTKPFGAEEVSKRFIEYRE
ncbi:uncharacterized protein LOC125041908 [Penaeus chinensis]|uniref:uncharacterized protein LOC125041908 n=1 Tax=Penaeus chinensis TaxID=139456 RepID=UPI001FB5EF3A|nr:uncharacterized protein LOC125041908 [Penaeus chinensis]XP_047493252.1 uncharacterized protein LOC125041908 [Penaeus chinensis]XP_047493253.1 uncharacterized protein LOC125041908 [Penaeus chinensis]